MLVGILGEDRLARSYTSLTGVESSDDKDFSGVGASNAFGILFTVRFGLGNGDCVMDDRGEESDMISKQIRYQTLNCSN
jgi:hypothetical protein